MLKNKPKISELTSPWLRFAKIDSIFAFLFVQRNVFCERALYSLFPGVTLSFKQDKHRDRTEETKMVVEKLQEKRKEKLEEERWI